MPTPRFHITAFALSLLAALLVYGSWAWWPATVPAWQAIDETVFFTLNGSLAGREWWQAFWAFGNSDAFDVLAAATLAALLLSYSWDANRARLFEKLSVAIWICLSIVIAVFIGKNAMAFGRESPSLLLEPVIRLTEMVGWIKAKDFSYNSYPSDHATVLLIMALSLTRLASRRLIMLTWCITFLFMLPRLTGGAHWFSDMAAGALPLALVITTLFLDTPLLAYGARLIHRAIDRPLFHEALTIILNPEAPILLAKGMAMGTADIIPGVSGGTIAYITGIWHRLIAAINRFNLAWFKLFFRLKWTEALALGHFRFLFPLLTGIAIAIVIFTKVIPIPVLIKTHPEPVYGLFFGLIGASILILLQELGRLTIREGGMLALGTVAGWLLVTLVPVTTPETSWFVFLCGFIAISAMLLPGLSGSFILLILGKYAYVLDALGSLNGAVIAPFVAGCAVGVITFARLAGWLLHHFYRLTVLAIVGILTGSLWIIWPFQERTYVMVREKARLIKSAPIWPGQWNPDTFLAIALAFIGFVIILVLHWIAHSAKKQARAVPNPEG